MPKRGGSDAGRGGSRRQKTKKAEPAPAYVVGRACRVRLLGAEEWLSASVIAISGADRRSLDLQLADDEDGVGHSCRVHLDQQPVHVADEIVWAKEPPGEGKGAATAGQWTPALLYKPLGPPEVESCGPKRAREDAAAGGAAFSGRVTEGEFLEIEVAEPSNPSRVSWKPGEVRQVLSGGRFTCCVNGDEDFIEEYGPEDEGAEWRKVADQEAARKAFEEATEAALKAGVQLQLTEYLGSGRRGFASRSDCLPLVRQMWKRKTDKAQLKAVAEALRLRRALSAPYVRGLKKQLAGARVAIYWPDDDEWYCGRVQQYEAREGKHAVLYDDGVLESLDLAEESLHIFSSEQEEMEFGAHSKSGLCFLCGHHGTLARLKETVCEPVRQGEEAASPPPAPAPAPPAPQGDAPGET